MGVDVRRLLLLACGLAAIPVLWRVPEALNQIRTERVAAVTYRHGLRLQTLGQLNEAAGVFREVLCLVPSASAPLVSLAEVEFRRGRFEEASRIYRKILTVYPYAYVGSLHREVGLVEFRRGKLNEAREDFRRAAEYDPEDWFAHYLFGVVAYRLGDRGAARGAWARTLQLNPTFRPARDRLTATQ